MRPAAPKHLLAVLALAATCLLPAAAPAATCDLNLEQAYQKAVSRGWGFKCLNSVLVFNQAKRPGCFLKTGVAKSVLGTGNLFCGSLRNGWRLVDFDVTGGPFGKSGHPSCLAAFFFPGVGAFTSTQRYLSKFTVEKDGGNCANALDEAF